jgi:hypothetical protein
MAIFRVQVNYTFQTVQKWSNVWHVQAGGLADVSAAVVTDMEPWLITILATTCTLKSFLISDEASDAFLTVDRNTAGTYAFDGPLLPLWNAIKVIFPPSDFGRPDLKYLKGIVGENVQDDGILSNAIQTGVDSAIEGMIDAMAAISVPLCSSNGDVYENAQVQPAVQMRQMHRKRRKKVVTP